MLHSFPQNFALAPYSLSEGVTADIIGQWDSTCLSSNTDKRLSKLFKI
jgi:hypothetical protein